jgi:hypothetical protein
MGDDSARERTSGKPRSEEEEATKAPPRGDAADADAEDQRKVGAAGGGAYGADPDDERHDR